MNRKLTLTIEQALVERAKKYAKGKGRSLSDLIENYLKMVTKDESDSKTGISPVVSSLKGSFHAPEDFDYKKILSEALSEKYV